MTARPEAPTLDYERIEKFIFPVPFSGCWLWTGTISKKGYARAYINGKDVRVHRWIYEQIHGPLGNLTADHLCRVRSCVNPAHIEGVTNAVNILRGVSPTAINAKAETCKNGHRFDLTITRPDGSTHRRCSICERNRKREHKRKKRAAALLAKLEKEKE